MSSTPTPGIVETTFKVFTVTKELQGQMRTFHFTTHDTTVTANGVQYIPLSVFDLEAWQLCK